MKNSQPVIVRAFIATAAAAVAVAAVAVPGTVALADSVRVGVVSQTVVADAPVAQPSPMVASPEPGFGWG